MVYDEIKNVNGIKCRLCSSDNPDCKNEFFRVQGEINRNLKLGRPIYCSLSCCRIVSNRNGNRNNDHLRKYKRQPDEDSPFRYYIKVMHNSNRKDCEVSIDDIREIWTNQNGICPYTGLHLVLPRTSNGFDEKADVIARASIDRIDSSLPYTKDNIQFVSHMANYAKADKSHEDMVRFCEAIAKNWSKQGQSLG